MMIVRNPSNWDEWNIRYVPLEEAQQLRVKGVKMYDYTMLTAVNTCPTWGVVRYGLNKTEVPLSAGGRRMAIECGKACHDFFAALRLWNVLESTKERPLVENYGRRLFGDERLASMLEVPQDSDRVNNAQLFALNALHTSGFYDDPNDRRRTMTNMESSCLVYSDRYFRQNMPVLVQDNIIGIELPFVLEVRNTFDDWTAYYCGRIDGIQLEEDGNVVVCENKTASRLSDTWRMMFAISHQVTGYTIAASALLGRDVWNAYVMGVQVPLPRDAGLGVEFEFCTRTESDRIRWCEWFLYSVSQYEAWTERPTEAPRYSHSCNRYFSACEFIPFCALTREEQVEALADMREEEWSPLDHVKEETGATE